MKLVIDLGESSRWVTQAENWPSWLDTAWLRDNDALIICQLTRADDLDRLRSLAPDPARLLAYPSYPSLERHLTRPERDRVNYAFLQQLGANAYFKPGSEARKPEDNEFTTLTKIDSPQTSSEKLNLALVTPMPPSVSGIANYCLEVLPHLEAFYNITLVVDDPTATAAALQNRHKVISHAEFMIAGNDFERVMYHFGNSHFHYDYFTLLKARPGVVVLHDIYLGDCIFSNFENMGKTQLLQNIYISHGWNALPDCEGPVRRAISLYPACGSLFTDSYGVIVHNKFARETLSLYFSKALLRNVSDVVLARQIKTLPEQPLARQKLSFGQETTLFASFGLINHNKCISQLLEAWRTTGLADNSCAILCLVGGCGDATLEEKIQSQIQSLPNPDQVILTGFVDNDVYDLYLSAADVAIQLRENSRGESSAALLDCMAAGLTTVVNAHGSMAEVPDDSVLKVADDFTIGELSEALLSSYESIGTDLATGVRAREFIEINHSPRGVAAAYTQQMESSYQNSAERVSNEVYAEIFSRKVYSLAADSLWACTSEYDDFISCASQGTLPPTGVQLLVDISAVVQQDLKSGIQRVVRNILRELLQRRDLGHRVEAVYYDFQSQEFRYARSFINQFLGIPSLYLSDDPVETHKGDIYLGLDLYYVVAGREESRKWLQYWRGRGVKLYNVIYDLMPVVLPDCFPPDQIPLYKDWLKAISSISDGVVCISRAVADDYCSWLGREEPAHTHAPNIGYFHLGAEMEADSITQSIEAAEENLLGRLRSLPFLLMVGTIEPRKGHKQVLEAFEVLWRRGEKLQLVIVGSTGWIDDEFTQYMHELDTKSDNLHLLNFVSEGMLCALYQHAAGTIMASLGEGFGLPLIEAAYYGSPLIARDLPVFREVCGDNAWYFSSTNGSDFVAELEQWLKLLQNNSLPRPTTMSWLNWEESTRQLLDNILDENWYIASS